MGRTRGLLPALGVDDEDCDKARADGDSCHVHVTSEHANDEGHRPAIIALDQRDARSLV
jgi:hypothetical protein